MKFWNLFRTSSLCKKLNLKVYFMSFLQWVTNIHWWFGVFPILFVAMQKIYFTFMEFDFIKNVLWLLIFNLYKCKVKVCARCDTCWSLHICLIIHFYLQSNILFLRTICFLSHAHTNEMLYQPWFLIIQWFSKQIPAFRSDFDTNSKRILVIHFYLVM